MILVILLQQGKGGGMASMFGGGSGMDDMLSAPGSDVILKKTTVTLATLFLFTSLILAIKTSRSTSKSIMDDQQPSAPVETEAPAQNEEPVPIPEDIPEQ